MKGQDKAMTRQSKETDRSNTPDREFRVMIRILNGLDKSGRYEGKHKQKIRNNSKDKGLNK